MIPRPACWALIFLGAHSEWKEKVKAEANALIAAHTDTLSTEPLHKRLSSVPMHAWEDELPVMDSIIRETLRLTMSGTTLRRNLGKDVALSETTLRKGDFLAYSIADAHLDSDLYPEPLKFDPNRYQEDRAEDKKETFAYIGWGVGKLICQIIHSNLLI